MKKHLITLLIGLVLVFAASGVQAVSSVDLYDWGFNIDGTVYNKISNGNVPGDLPGYVSTGGLDFGTGLGSVSVTITGTGSHSLISFFDHEIDEIINGYTNEFGDSHGALATGQSWEIDEPGWVFGDIFTNFSAGSLDNSNGVQSSSPDDVSLALGWDFTLASGETALIDFLLSYDAPSSGFYLSQTDPDSGAEIYLSSTKQVRGGGCTNNCPVPEPGTVILLGSGIAGLFFFGKKRLSNKA